VRQTAHSFYVATFEHVLNPLLGLDFRTDEEKERQHAAIEQAALQNVQSDSSVQQFLDDTSMCAEDMKMAAKTVTSLINSTHQLVFDTHDTIDVSDGGQKYLQDHARLEAMYNAQLEKERR
jgi:hypothetical protein